MENSGILYIVLKLHWDEIMLQIEAHRISIKYITIMLIFVCVFRH